MIARLKQGPLPQEAMTLLLHSGDKLRQIYEEQLQKKKQHSDLANAWNKSHPERHREINRKSAKRKRDEVNNASPECLNALYNIAHPKKEVN